MRSRTLRVRLAQLAAASLLLTGCSSMNGMLGGNSQTQALNGLKWDYADHAIGVSWRASPHLNAYENEAHAVTVLVVQMSDPNVFRQAIATPAQLSQLLLATTLPAGVLDMRRYFAQPGQNGQVWLARAQGAQYVGVVVGYYTLQPDTTARLFKIGVQVKSSGLIVKKRIATPDTLAVALGLGDSGLVGGQSAVAGAPAVPKPGDSEAVPLGAAAAVAASAADAAGALAAPSLPAPSLPSLPSLPAPPATTPSDLMSVPDAGSVDGSDLGSDATDLMHLAPMPSSAPHL